MVHVSISIDSVTSTHIQISTVSLADMCELPEENNAVQLAPVRSATALSVSPTVSLAVEFR